MIKASLQAFFVVFLWATSWVLIKIGLQEIPSITFAGLRYFLAFFCLLPFLFLSRQWNSLRSLSKGQWVRLLLLGVLFYALTQGASFVALAYLPAITVNLIWSFSSVTVALMGIAWLAERPTGFQWLGIVLATFGAVVYFYPVSILPGQLIGVLVALVGVLANGISSILGRAVNRSGEIHPLSVTVISMGLGAILLLAVGLATQGLPPLSARSWAIVLWLAIINTAFAFTLWNHTLRTLSAVQSSIINGTMLVWIPVLAVIFLGEKIALKELLGLVVVGIGTLIVQLREPRVIKNLLSRQAVE